MRHQEQAAKADRYLAEARHLSENDPWRLRYHAMPLVHWMNDPNGFCWYQGEYHLFYQHHPYSPKWDDMHWGHIKSKDLVHWTGLPIALAPSEDYDRDGCFSGSAIEKDGKLYLMYTGNLWTGPDHEQDLKQVQCLAVSDDGVHFEKWPANPVIKDAPAKVAHPYHIRDPKVWERDGSYYCVLGSRTAEHVGQILLYRSENLTNWTFVGVLASGTSSTESGYMWECPDLFVLGGQDILVLSPQGVKPVGDKYHNLHQAGYMLGKLDYESGSFKHDGFEMLDHGFDFYAPQTLEDPKGRRILIAWMAMWESNMPEQRHHWAGAMTVPRELLLEDGKIRSRPVEELNELRGKLTEFNDLLIINDRIELEGLNGDSYELELLLDVTDATEAGIHLRTNARSGERTSLVYEKKASVVTLDRNHSGAGPGGTRRAQVPAEDGLLQLRIYVDRSSVEVFVQDGSVVMTARIYPDDASTGIQLYAKGQTKVVQLRKWNLHRRDGVIEGVGYGE